MNLLKSKFFAERRVLLGAIGVMGVLALYRYYHYLVTGFFLPDEYTYAIDAWSNQIYGYRLFSGYVNIAIFHLFGIKTVDNFATFLPIYIIFWAIVTLCAFYGIMRTLGFNVPTISWSIFTSLFLVAFTLVSLGFLTEPMGLSLATLGVYFLIRWMKTSTTLSSHLLLPLLAALSFVAAMYTREPYVIYTVGMIPVAVVIALRKRNDFVLMGSRVLPPILAALSFSLPAAFFLIWPVDLSAVIISPSLNVAISSIARLVSHASSATTSTIATSTIATSVTTQLTHSLSSTSSTTTTVIAGTNPSAFGGAVGIFSLGLLLGWGPVPLILTVAGLLILTYQFVQHRNGSNGIVLLLCIIALGSNLVVSFILAGIPYYFSSGAYSAIIRFSDGGIPAFSLAAPFAISHITKNRRRVIGLFLVLLLTIAVSVPLYSKYASSGLGSTQVVGSDPFLLGFRTPSAMIRDYVLANPGQGQFNIIGVPTYYTFTDVWNFTPGTQGLPVDFFRSISAQSFLQHRWSAFYVYGDSGANDSLFDRYPFSALLSSQNDFNSTLPFHVVNRQVIFNQTAYLIKFQLAWS